MNKTSNAKLALIFITISLSNSYILSRLGHLGVPAEQSLIGRGISCMLVSIAFALYSKEKVLPSSLKVQFMRFFLSGFGLWAIIESYIHTRVSEVILISRIDIPIIILFGFSSSKEDSRYYKLLAFGLIALIISSIWIFSNESTTFIGLSLATFGTILLSISYLLLRYTSKNETSFIVALTPSLACVIFGSVISLLKYEPFIYDSSIFALISISGFFMYLSYQVIRLLYKRLTFLQVQSIYIFIPLLSILIDLFIYQTAFTSIEYLFFIIISLFAFGLCTMRGQLNLWRD